MKETLNVANEIKNQIGNRALFMLGAKNLLGGENYLSFKISGCREVSHIRITLEPSDTYKMEFIKCRGTAIRTIREQDGVYCDGLNQMIESVTGLHTSL